LKCDRRKAGESFRDFVYDFVVDLFPTLGKVGRDILYVYVYIIYV